MQGKLILLRHGKSAWNSKNLFTGWVDIPLDARGIEESAEAGKKIQNVPIDMVFTSTLIRAQMTAVLALMHHSSGKICVFVHPEEKKGRVYSTEAEKELIPVHIAWQLNERLYGSLQGLNKAEMAKKYGAEQVQAWRRSFDGVPPDGESLEMTAKRTLPYFRTAIEPLLAKGKTILIAAHGNSLRSIVMHLDGLSPSQIVSLEIPTGEPIFYSYQDGRYVRT